MKAKLIKTGKIVNVVPVDGGWCDTDFKTYSRQYNDDELDFDFQDWESFRREAAKDFVCALLQDNRTSYSQPYEWFCGQAICLADELIRQLREDEK